MKTTLAFLFFFSLLGELSYAELTDTNGGEPSVETPDNSPSVPIPQRVREMVEGYRKSTIECPEKVWPDYSWKGKKVVFVYAEGQNSFIWDSDTDSITPIETNDLPPSAVSSYYEYFDLEGKRAMSLEMKQDDAFKLGSHEFFHEIAQDGWYSQNDIGTRGSEYPFSAKARYYRRMVYDNLKTAYTMGSTDALGKAKYWHEKWKTEFPNEFKAATDTYEGTPQYVETISQAIANNGCEAHQGVLKRDMIQQVNSDFGGAFQGEFFGLDSEGYDLGALASLLLQDRQKQGWHKRVSEGYSPLDILFEDVMVKPNPGNSSILSNYSETIAVRNREVGKLMDQDIARFNETDYVRVSVPYEWLQQNLTPHYFVAPSALPKTTGFPVHSDHRFSSPDSASQMTLKHEGVVFFQPFNETCNTHMTLVHKDDLKSVAGGSFDLTSTTLNGRIRGERKTDSNGFTYICAQ